MTAPDLSDRPLRELTSLEGRVAVVTGGARGVGAAICRRLAELGAMVVVADIDRESAEAEAAAIGRAATAAALDVTDPASVTSVVDATAGRHGRLDIWVSNAGVYPRIDFTDMTLEQWTQVLEINLTGPLLCAQAASVPMVEQGGGVIINIASLSAYRVAAPGLAQYVASKAGLVGLTKALAVELGPKGIRVVGVAPCMVADVPTAARSPLGRSALPDDIARVVAYLATDSAAFVSGITVPVDGGELCGVTAVEL
jgi:NAD(P)-dependent dehydrogenase (short-subunit alcohol dehydrogenase family)